VPGFPEFGADIEFPALKSARKMDGLQLIFEIRRLRWIFRAKIR
jgi:hypothetical protein